MLRRKEPDIIVASAGASGVAILDIKKPSVLKLVFYEDIDELENNPLNIEKGKLIIIPSDGKLAIFQLK